jgi:uncharacterized phage protein (TIGR01671 family)
MREIKFRCWDIENNKIIGWESMQAWRIDAIQSPNIMQFTGLHDKNGKEIYENDIVKIQVDEYKKTYTECRVGWHIDGYKCFYGLDNEKKWDNGIPYEDWSDDVDWEECVVIGNIYQNPELIK